MENLGGLKRTHKCATLGETNIGQKVTVMGWAQTYRQLGALIFVDLRDISGIVQLSFNEQTRPDVFEKAKSIRNEFVLAATGTVIKRSSPNKNIPTGMIEIDVDTLKILSVSQTPPIAVKEDSNVKDELRLKYRYLDLRRPDIQKNIILRHKIAQAAREYLNSNEFLEIETPMLTKSTPEGARDYLVPSRVHPGKFYALPQSPQLYKQLLMMSGMDRYYQIVKCFRDEDLRADRQPEFTQIDTEMSFVEREDVMAMTEGMFKHIFKTVMGMDIQTPFKRIPYDEAMSRYGSDKPDTRFGLELINVSDVVKNSEFKVFSDAVQNGGSVRGINLKGKASSLSRKEIDALVEFVKTYRAKGLAWMSLTAEGVKSSFNKFLTDELIASLSKACDAETGDILLFVADADNVVFDALGALRVHLAKKFDMIEKGTFDLLWVIDFPLFEYDEEEKRYVAKHHPFTAPMDEDIKLLDTDPSKVRAKAYDIVMNGYEVGGGSIRIHTSQMQEIMFEKLGFTQDDAQARFGFLIDALKFGAPPHGGLACGLDRLVMLLAGEDSIRDVIAFPKVQNASELMTNAPDKVDEKQLEELSVAIRMQE